MNKGIILEVQNRNITVLTPTGEYIKCKKKNSFYAVGEEITFSDSEIVAGTFNMPSFLRPQHIATLAACVIAWLVLIIYTGNTEKVMAYVAIDINPSLEAAVDEELHVIGLKAYNEDGKRILKELKDWKNSPLEQVVKTVIDQSKKAGYLNGTNDVTLTSVVELGKEETKLQQALDKKFKDIKEEYQKQNIAVALQKSTIKERETAKKAGKTTGKYKEEQKRQEEKIKPVPQEKSKPVQSSPPASQPNPQPKQQENNRQPKAVPKQGHGNKQNYFSPPHYQRNGNGNHSSKEKKYEQHAPEQSLNKEYPKK